MDIKKGGDIMVCGTNNSNSYASKADVQRIETRLSALEKTMKAVVDAINKIQNQIKTELNDLNEKNKVLSEENQRLGTLIDQNNIRKTNQEGQLFLNCVDKFDKLFREINAIVENFNEKTDCKFDEQLVSFVHCLFAKKCKTTVQIPQELIGICEIIENNISQQSQDTFDTITKHLGKESFGDIIVCPHKGEEFVEGKYDVSNIRDYNDNKNKKWVVSHIITLGYKIDNSSMVKAKVYIELENKGEAQTPTQSGVPGHVREQSSKNEKATNVPLPPPYQGLSHGSVYNK